MPHLHSPRFSAQGAALRFEMDGQSFAAIDGETIAAALIAQGCVGFKRDRHGQPRGVSCGMGACFECEVSVDGAAPVRACLTKVRSGMRVRSIDYHKISRAPDADVNTGQARIDSDVLIVGAGPAGMSAALSLADAGVGVTLVDERADPGGQYFKPLAVSQRFTVDRATDAQYREGVALAARLRESAVRVIDSATVWGVFTRTDGGFEASVVMAETSVVISARKVILAAGAFESMPAFPGWTLPGVMSTGAAQGLARAYRVAAGERVLIAGNGPLNLQLACELLDGGVEVLAVAESAPKPFPRRLGQGLGLFGSAPSLALRGMGYLRTLKRHGVPVLHGYHIAEATGDKRVEQCTVAMIKDDGSLRAGTEQRYAVDAVCVGYGLQPSNELARALGCKHVATAGGVTTPQRNDLGETSVPGVFIIGDSGVLGGAQLAQAEGRIAGRAVASSLCGGSDSDVRAERKLLHRHRRFQRHLWSFYQAPEYVPADPQTLICRCESVSLATVSALVEAGVSNLGRIKQSSRAGMGSCQGRYCQRQLARIVDRLAGDALADKSLFEAQVPIKPVVIAKVAQEKPEWVGYRSIDGQFAPRPLRSVREPVQLDAEVVIVGAGVIGLSTALHLARAGRDVLVVDARAPLGEASGTNAGSLHGQILSSDFTSVAGSADAAGLTLGLQRLGIAEWQALQTDSDVDFELAITGGLVVAGNADELAFLQQKTAWEQRHGLTVELIGQSELRALLPCVSAQMIGAAYCQGEGKINPLLAGPVLLDAARAAGVRLRSPCAVAAIEASQGLYTIEANTARIRCARLVNAAGGWAPGIAGLLGLTLPVRTAPQQMIVTEPLDPMIPLLVAAAQRHLTLKQVANGNVIIGGGWPAAFDAERGRAVNLRESIEGNLWVAQHVIPSLAGARMLRSWATVGVMIDGAPILGEFPGQHGFFNAVGANGYTMGPILGRITAGLILGDEPPLDLRPFSVERFH